MRNFLFLLLVFISSQALSQVTLGPSKRTVYDLDSWDSLIAVVADNGLEIWDISQRRILDSAAYDGTSQFSSVCFGRDYRELVTGRRSGRVS